MDPRTSAQHVIAVLHVAHYYGAGRLVALCEAFLAKELKRGDKDDEGNFADGVQSTCCYFKVGRHQGLGYAAVPGPLFLASIPGHNPYGDRPQAIIFSRLCLDV